MNENFTRDQAIQRIGEIYDLVGGLIELAGYDQAYPLSNDQIDQLRKVESLLENIEADLQEMEDDMGVCPYCGSTAYLDVLARRECCRELTSGLRS